MLFTLFAESSPTWTDKEVLIALGSVVGTMVSVALFVLRFMNGSLRRRLRVATKENQELRDRLVKEEKEDPRIIDELKSKLQLAERDVEAVSIELASTKDRALTLDQSMAKLKTDLHSATTSLEEHADALSAERRRIEKATSRDGATWTERVLSNVPEFKPLEPDGRRTPIISVLNLKGGVGKTTIAANLGAAFDARGYRSLMLDLDLQGSLTSLFVREGDQLNLQTQGKMLGDFLAAAFDSEFPNVLDYVQPILPEGKSALAPTADDMAYAEMNLTLRWLLRETRRDPRFLLRKELHLRRVTSRFDIVLMDCPPLINVCCVNALAASDYVVIPVLPSKQATARVPVLLKRLKEFRDAINPALKVMGIVCNRTSRSELTAEEENRLTMLRGHCFDVWGEEVKQLETFIRQSREVRAAEDERRPLGEGDEMREIFTAFAAEVEDRLPMFCRPAQKPSPAEVPA